ncbi:MAG: GTPase Era [Clostridia bacterium]|nr:GTPase Era [Clostridia bacterium]
MKSGFVSIVGRANVGKSTLMNSLIGEKIAIVSDKPQTTRGRVTGIYNDDDVQLVFIDTPGIHTPKNKLGEHMIKTSAEAFSGVDVVLFVAEAKKPRTAELQIIEKLKGSSVPVILVLNKVDIIPKGEVAEAIGEYSQLYPFASIIPVSAKREDGVDIVLNEILPYIDEGELLYPTDIATDMTSRQLVEEIVREKFLNNLYDEIPHGIAIETVVYKDTETTKGEPISNININIICEKEQHKGMIIGKKGAMLKKTMSEARADIEDLLGQKIYMECHVKVRENWRDNESLIRSYGLNFME